MKNRILYKYVDIEFLKRILDSRSIRFTQPGAFNDPYELLPEIMMHSREEDVHMQFSFDLTAKRRRTVIEDVVQPNFVSSDVTSRNIVKELNKSIGFFCMSKNNDSMLMWSHYANQYTGAVIGLDIENEYFSNLIEVEYQENRPIKTIASYHPSPVPISELCTKSKDWEYEHEVRMVSLLSDCVDTGIDDKHGFRVFVQNIPLECLKIIMLGERTSVDDQREIYLKLKTTDIGLSLSAIDNRGYKFRQEVIKYPMSHTNNLGPNLSPRTAHIFSHLNTPLGGFARTLIKDHPLSKIVNNIA
jgi:hypothetical protein